MKDVNGEDIVLRNGDSMTRTVTVSGEGDKIDASPWVVRRAAREWQIWIEGSHETPCECLGVFTADTFLEACQMHDATQTYSDEFNRRVYGLQVKNGIPTRWCLRLFDNEADAKAASCVMADYATRWIAE